MMTTPPPETMVVSTRTPACDGDEGPLGHPRVYLNMGSGAQVTCPYCDRLFVLKGSNAEALIGKREGAGVA